MGINLSLGMGPSVRQSVDAWFTVTTLPTAARLGFPGEIFFGAAGVNDASSIRSFQSASRRSAGFSRIRGGVSSDVAGTLYVMQSWRVEELASYGVVISGATLTDVISSVATADFDVQVTRTFCAIRFTGNSDLSGRFEIGAMLVPI